MQTSYCNQAMSRSSWRVYMVCALLHSWGHSITIPYTNKIWKCIPNYMFYPKIYTAVYAAYAYCMNIWLHTLHRLDGLFHPDQHQSIRYHVTRAPYSNDQYTLQKPFTSISYVLFFIPIVDIVDLPWIIATPLTLSSTYDLSTSPLSSLSSPQISSTSVDW